MLNRVRIIIFYTVFFGLYTLLSFLTGKYLINIDGSLRDQVGLGMIAFGIIFIFGVTIVQILYWVVTGKSIF